MNKQEEIREGIAQLLFDWLDCKDVADNYDISQKILSYLHENQVVIKVDKELPGYVVGISATNDGAKFLAEEVQGDMLRAGYVAVEPLIIEEE